MAATDFFPQGAAFIQDDKIYLTTATPDTWGGVFTVPGWGSEERCDWSLTVMMELLISGNKRLDGDGLAISLVYTETPSFAGEDGGCLGCAAAKIGEICTPQFDGWTVELDTWWNNVGDPSSLHLAIEPDCDVNAPAAWVDLTPTVDRAALWRVWQPLTVQLTPSRLLAALPDVGAEVALDEEMHLPQWIFITASTGEAWNAHAVRDLRWELTAADLFE